MKASTAISGAIARRGREKLRRLALWLGILFVAVAAVPTWRRYQYYAVESEAHRLMAEGSLPAAISLLENLQRERPDSAEVAYLLGVAKRRSGRFDDAFKHLQTAEDAGWPLEDLTRQRFMARFQAGDIAGTQNYLQNLLVEGATNEVAEEVYEALAKGFLAEFRVSDAAVVLDHWLAWQPNAIPALRWRAELHEQDEKWSAAAEGYRRIVYLDPKAVDDHLHLADALLADQKVKEAQTEYQAIFQRFPDDKRACFGWAQCARRLGNPSEAAKLLKDVMDAEVGVDLHSRAWVEMAQISLQAGDYNQAAKSLENAVSLEPRNSQTHHLLGTTLARLGETEEAQKHLDQAQAILDGHRRIRKLSLEVATQPGNVDARFNMARELIELGNDEEASRWLLTVIHLSPNHEAARKALGDLFASRGMHDLATGHYQIAERLRQARERAGIASK